MSEEATINEWSAVAIIDGQERPVETQIRQARGLRTDPPTDLFVVAGSNSGRGTQAGQLVGAVIENELRRAPGKVARYLPRAIEAAQTRLQEKAGRSPSLDWTASVACILIVGQELIFAGVGQAAAFLLRDGQLEFIEDGSDPSRPWINARLGAADPLRINLCAGRLEPGDRVLIVVGHLPPHLSGARLRYQLGSSPDQIIQELRSTATPEDCLAAFAFGWDASRQSASRPVRIGSGDEAIDDREPVRLPVGAYTEAEIGLAGDVAVGGGRLPPRRSPEPAIRPHTRVTAPPVRASVGGPWQSAGVAGGGRARPAPDSGHPGTPRRASGGGRPAEPEAEPGLGRIGLTLLRRVMREFVPDNQAGLSTGFVHAGWREGAARAARRSVGRGWLIGLAVGLVCLIAIGFLVVRVGLSRQDPREEFATLVARAEAARSAAATAPDREAARKQLGLASDSLKAALAILPNDSTALSTQDQITKDLRRLNGVLALPKASQLVDLTALAGTTANATGIIFQNGRAYLVDNGSGKVFRFVLTATPDGAIQVEDKMIIFQQDDQISDIRLGTPVSLLWATADNGRAAHNLLVLDAFRNLYQFNSPTERIKVPVRGAGEWKSLKQAVSYQGNLYILDTEADQVWRYYPAAGGYDSEMKAMLESAELSDVTGFGIDGDIYLLSSTGKVRKYVGGVATDFKMTGLDTAIGKGASIFTNRDTKLVYVADPANGRVVVFDKNGAFKWQIVDERFRNVSTLTVDEKGKLLLFVAGNQVYQAPLPAEVASTG